MPVQQTSVQDMPAVDERIAVFDEYQLELESLKSQMMRLELLKLQLAELEQALSEEPSLATPSPVPAQFDEEDAQGYATLHSEDSTGSNDSLIPTRFHETGGLPGLDEYNQAIDARNSWQQDEFEAFFGYSEKDNDEVKMVKKTKSVRIEEPPIENSVEVKGAARNPEPTKSGVFEQDEDPVMQKRSSATVTTTASTGSAVSGSTDSGVSKKLSVRDRFKLRFGRSEVGGA